MSVFIDTGAFIAYRNKKDVYYTTADKLIRRALQKEFGTIFTTGLSDKLNLTPL